MHVARCSLLVHASAPFDAGSSQLDASPAGAEGAEDSVSRRGGYSRRFDDRSSARGAQGFRQGCSRGMIYFFTRSAYIPIELLLVGLCSLVCCVGL